MTRMMDPLSRDEQTGSERENDRAKVTLPASRLEPRST